MAELQSSGKDRIITNQGIIKLSKNDDNFIFFDGDKYRMVVGFDENNDPVVKISKPGFNVLEATDDQLIFNSSQNVFKIVDSGNTSLNAVVPVAGDSVQKIIPHNLGYAPIPLVFIQLPGGYRQLPAPTGYHASGGDILFNSWVSAVTDADNLYIDFAGGSAANYGTWNFKYYLLQETAA